jgi:hypothetical protein
VEGRIHDREPGGLDHLDAFRAEAGAVKKTLRLAEAASEVTDEVQTVHFRPLQNAKAQPADEGTRLRFPSAATAAKQSFSIALNSFKTS